MKIMQTKQLTRIDDVVADICAELDQYHQEQLLALPKDQLFKLHFSLGTAIRNRYGV